MVKKSCWSPGMPPLVATLYSVWIDIFKNREISIKVKITDIQFKVSNIRVDVSSWLAGASP